jgi:hypothetical protein
MEQNIQTASFVEMVVVNPAQTSNPDFDIILDDKVTLQNYCNALIKRIFELPQSEYSAFINYQSNLVKEPIVWLNKLEKLIASNEVLFTGKCALSRYNKLFNLIPNLIIIQPNPSSIEKRKPEVRRKKSDYIVIAFGIIEKKRSEVQSSGIDESKLKTPKRLINADAEDRHFSFCEVKEHIETLEGFNEKIMHLTEEIFEYKQADIISKNSKLLDYDFQCSQLIEKLQTIRKMRTEFEKEQQEIVSSLNSNPIPLIKIQLNGPINILTDVYKQMMNNVKPNGKPYIQYKIKDIAKFICASYVDENGNELSMLTIQTYLSPTRTDKNPNNDWKIKL